MRDLALFDSEHGPRLQRSGILLVVLSLCILSGFFIDLMQALALRAPFPVVGTVLAVFAGLAVAMLIPISGACAGIPERTKGSNFRQSKITGLLLLLGGAIALARYAKALDHLEAEQRTAAERARVARLEAATAARRSPEAKARAEILSAQAKMLAASAEALEKGTARLTPKVREHAVEMAKLATVHLPGGQSGAGSGIRGQSPVSDSTVGESTGQSTSVSRPTVAPRSETISTIKVMQFVIGPALTEFLLAELIAFVASIWGAAAFAPVRTNKEVIEGKRHHSLRDVDLALLNEEALDGLDTIGGTWRGLELGRPAERGRGRKAVVWPTLAMRGDGARVFIGSPQSIAYARIASPKASTNTIDKHEVPVGTDGERS